MQNNRPVFESFDQFVQFVYEAAQLNEADTSHASPILKILKGGMKLSGESATAVDQLVTLSLNKYFTDKPWHYLGDESPEVYPDTDNYTGKAYAEQVIDYLQTAFDALNNSAGLATIPGKVDVSKVEGEYKYLINGTIRIKDIPDGENGNFGSEISDGVSRIPLGEALARIDAHNFKALGEVVARAKKGKGFTNAGTEANLKQFNDLGEKEGSRYKFVAIDPASLTGDTLILKTYVPKADDKVEYAWQFPVYGIPAPAEEIKPGGGEPVEANYYDEVILPAGNDVVVKEQEYDLPDVKFFEENGVTISEEGKRQLKSVLSQYNSITTITVNGGASSKPTSYKSKSGEGNPALATDRMNAGIAELNALKKSGVAQLANTKIEPGKAEVQSEGKSDPKKQQVSFIISGMIKSTQIVPKEAVVVQNTELLKADAVSFTQYTFQVNINEEPTAKNMQARA